MKAHIVVVDDDQLILEAVEILLKTSGYQVTIIQDLSNIVSQVTELKPDLLLLDLLLSGVDGRDIAQQLKTQPSTKNLPIIMMSADTFIKEKSSEAGVDAYIKKPFDIDELERMLTDHLRQN